MVLCVPGYRCIRIINLWVHFLQSISNVTSCSPEPMQASCKYTLLKGSTFICSQPVAVTITLHSSNDALLIMASLFCLESSFYTCFRRVLLPVSNSVSVKFFMLVWIEILCSNQCNLQKQLRDQQLWQGNWQGGRAVSIGVIIATQATREHRLGTLWLGEAIYNHSKICCLWF